MSGTVTHHIKNTPLFVKITDSNTDNCYTEYYICIIVFENFVDWHCITPTSDISVWSYQLCWQM